MYHAQAVIVNDKVYVGGGWTVRDELAYSICSFDYHRRNWTTFSSPARRSALTIYQSELVLVGGERHPTGELTNELWVLEDQEAWNQVLSSMPTKRWGATAVCRENRLIVAGGVGTGGPLDVVELYDNKQWSCIDPLPKPSYFMKVVSHDDFFYLSGGEGQGTSVFSTSLPAAITGPSPPTQTIWQTLPDVQYQFSSIALLQSSLINIGGGFPWPTASLYYYCTQTKKWNKLKSELPEPVHSTCSITLPTGEIIIIGGSGNDGYSQHVYRGTVKQ